WTIGVWFARDHLLPQVVTLVMARYPCVLCCTFRPFCLQPPLAVPRRYLAFHYHRAYRRPHRARYVESFGELASWASPLGYRLATATGRIEFAVADCHQPLLRTGRSPPVALHPSLRRRSYLRLRGTRPPRRGLPPRGCNNITGAHPSPRRGEGSQ